jgi:hypothetical protein
MLRRKRLVRTVFDSVRNGHWDDRWFYCFTVEEHATRPVLDAWCQQDPESALAHLLRAVQGVHLAWQVRGGKGASRTSGAEFAGFHEVLRQADADLIRAAELDPDHPTPHAYRITVGKGLSWDKSEVRLCLDEATRRDEHNLAAPLAYLSAVTEKWGGSHDMMFDFAYETAGRVPEGSELGILPIVAHMERWLYYAMDGDQPGAKRYLAEGPAFHECAEAYKRSLGHPDHRATRASVISRNHAAFMLYVLRDRTHLAPLIEKIGPHVTRLPWAFYGSIPVAELYEKACRFARE